MLDTQAREQLRARESIDVLEAKLKSATLEDSGTKGTDRHASDSDGPVDSRVRDNGKPFNADEIIAMYEKLGDKYIVLDKPRVAIKWYTKCVSKIQSSRGDGHATLAPLYASLALTLDDVGDAARAVHYYTLELAIHRASSHASKEVAETELRIAQVWMGPHGGRAEHVAAAAAAVDRARKAVDAAMRDVDNNAHPHIATDTIEAVYAVAAEIETTAHELAVLQASDTDRQRCAERQQALEARRTALSPHGADADDDDAAAASATLASGGGSDSDDGGQGSGSEIDFTASEEESAGPVGKEGNTTTTTIRCGADATTSLPRSLQWVGYSSNSYLLVPAA